MKAIHLRVALGCFVVGVGISALRSTLQKKSEVIHPVLLQDIIVSTVTSAVAVIHAIEM